MTAELPDLPAGVYRHWKGHQFLVLGYAAVADTVLDGKLMVVYVGLDPVGAQSSIRMRVRSVQDFFAWVDPTTGQLTWEDLESSPPPVQRFTYLGPRMELPS